MQSRLLTNSAAKHVFSIGRWHHAAEFYLQVLKLCTDLDWTLWYILVLWIYSKFIRENRMLALGVCLPQPSWRQSAVRTLSVYRSRLDYCRPIGSFLRKRIRWNALQTRFHLESDFIREIANSILRSGIRDTRYARQPAQYVNTSIRSTLVCQYALPFRKPYGSNLTQLSEGPHRLI